MCRTERNKVIPSGEEGENLARRLIACLLGLLCLTGTVYAQTLRFAETLQSSDPRVKAEMEFARLLEERTQGRVQLEIYPAGTLYGTEEGILEALSKGDIALGRVSTQTASSAAPELRILQLPYLFKNREHLWSVLDGAVGQEFLDRISANRPELTGLCYFDAGAEHFALREKRTLALEGLMISAARKITKDLVALLGGTAMHVGRHEVYAGLAQGVFAGAAETLWNYWDTGDYDAAPVLIEDAHDMAPDLVLASELVLEGMSPEDRALVEQAAFEMEAWEREAWQSAEKECRRKLEKAGVSFIALSQERRQELFSQALHDTDRLGESLYDRWGGEWMDLVAQVLLVREEY